MTGRSVIVTGANSGIGRAAARALAGAGAHVVLAVRNLDKGQAAAADMPGETEVRELDLASLASVREFAGPCGCRLVVRTDIYYAILSDVSAGTACPLCDKTEESPLLSPQRR